MKFRELPCEILTVRVVPVMGEAAFESEAPVKSFRPSIGRNGVYDLILKDESLAVRLVNSVDESRLYSLPATRLGWVTSKGVDGSFDLMLAPFYGEALEMGDLDIGVDEPVLDRYAKICFGKGSDKRVAMDDFGKAITAACQYSPDGPESPDGDAYFCLFAGPSVESYIERAEAEDRQDETLGVDGEADEGTKEVMNALNSFCIQGNGWRFVVTRREQGGKSVFCVTRLTKAPARPDHALRLARGRLTFSDRMATGGVRVLAKAQLDAIVKTGDSYFRKWDEYGAKEGEVLLGRARRFGHVTFDSKRQYRIGETGYVDVHIAEATDEALQELEKIAGDSVQLVDELPLYLTNPDVTFEDFCKTVIKQNEGEETRKNWIPGDLFREKKQDRKLAVNTYKVSDYDRSSRTLTLETEKIPSAKWIVLSLGGDIAQIKRRMYARMAISEGRAAIPQLGVIIEENGVPEIPLRGTKKVEALTAFVREKIFRNPPTFRQEEAISVALNTPDIALIQGPPGTGKTTVIAAIIERLNEEARRREDRRKGDVLLTGFQHDAVENMIDRISINSLPVLKFGRRAGERDEFSRSLQKLEAWCTDLEKKIVARHPEFKETAQVAELNDLYVQYIQDSSFELGLLLLGKILDFGVSAVGIELSRQIDALVAQLKQEQSMGNGLEVERSDLLRAIRSLRVTARGFADDGAMKAWRFLNDFAKDQDVLSGEERRVLTTAADCEDGKAPEPDILKAMQKLKFGLLKRFSAPPVFRRNKRNAQVEHLAKKAIEKIRASSTSGKSKREMALLNFLGSMRSDLRGMARAVSDYSFAFAATCQQSVNDTMQRQKGVGGLGSRFEYDYVIVDEAARVSPRDLLIPMVQGRHVILVGDHRQLPHIIDDEVARCFESGEKEEAEISQDEWLKKSMFEYLFSRARELEKHDGIKRRVTLDCQYRMHPLLGDFVSRNFYEHFDLSERFGSGLPDDNFAFDLPGMNGRPLAWLSVPVSAGRHVRAGTSLKREAEIEAIASRLEEWMRYSEEHPKPDGRPLTFGVISFYKAQADAINGKFKKWFADKDAARQAEKKRQLRIGTVDSFQGMEFDVVFLSMVRTLPDRFKPSGDDELDARRLFGHLCLYNRLNVAMSRQKRLLVVVGDPGLVQGELAEKRVHGLVNFHRLCKEKGVTLK